MDFLKTDRSQFGLRVIAYGTKAQRPRIVTCLPLLVLIATSAGLRAQQCPPGTFDYGLPCDREAEWIVLDHYGAEGPLLPVLEECARAARDQALIRGAFPEFADLHYFPYCGELDEIYIKTFTPTDPDLVCTNEYYQITGIYGPIFDWWIVKFPRSINPVVMAEKYRALPAVLYAEPPVCGEPAGDYGARSQWLYTPHPGRAWYWEVWNGNMWSHLYVSAKGHVEQRAAPIPGSCEEVSGAAGVAPPIASMAAVAAGPNKVTSRAEWPGGYSWWGCSVEGTLVATFVAVAADDGSWDVAATLRPHGYTMACDDRLPLRLHGVAAIEFNTFPGVPVRPRFEGLYWDMVGCGGLYRTDFWLGVIVGTDGVVSKE